jgi:hypothetical protein
MNRRKLAVLACGILTTLVAPAVADPLYFSTGDPDGKIGLASRPSAAGVSEIEAADDFLLTTRSMLTNATFTGLLPGGATLNDVGQVGVEIYRLFPQDSSSPPDGNVPTRVSSPADVAFDSRTSADGSLTFSMTTIQPDFAVANSILNGINPSPNQTTGGDGATTGIEVQFDITFNTGIVLPGDHYFFVPQVALSNGSTFLWLSAPKPILASSGTPFNSDLQAWIRDAGLEPDWLRAGTDIVGVGAFNAAFSLTGTSVPEPSTLVMLMGVAGSVPLGLVLFRRKDSRARNAARPAGG